jgi:LacI family transcriptional regulator
MEATSQKRDRPSRAIALRQATIADVARRAGASIATVSRVLNKVPRGYRGDLRERVLKAAKELDYTPNALARGLLQKRTRTLGALITDIANPYYGEITRGIGEIARQSGYALFVCNTDRRPETMAHYIDVLRENRVDAVIIGGGGTTGRRHFQTLLSRGIPAVLIGRYDVPLPAVRIDNVKGGWEAANHLISLGHKAIAILSGPMTSTSIQDRMRGYRRALRQNGLTVPEKWVLNGDLRPGSALHLAESLLASNPRPTAILAANDQMAIAAIRAALTLGLRVPGDLSVVGFDNIELASYVNPTLTTMGVPLYQVGVAAAETAIRLLDGTPRVREAWFVPELIIRESTARPPELTHKTKNPGVSGSRTRKE